VDFIAIAIVLTLSVTYKHSSVKVFNTIQPTVYYNPVL